MTDHDLQTGALSALLHRHDVPVDPSAVFADRLEARLLAELKPATGVASRRWPSVERSSGSPRPPALAGPVSSRRPRWFDTAAAAVLVIGLLGGMVSQLAGGGRITEPTRVAAPVMGVEPAVMSGGSAARDNRFAGPGPAQGELVERWTASPEPEGGARDAWQVIPAGDMLYQVLPGNAWDAADSQVRDTGFTLAAHALDTGALVWSRTDLRMVGVAVSEAGVVAVLSSDLVISGGGSRLALLAPATGDPLWALPLPDLGRDTADSPILDGDTVYYATSDTTVYAVDLATGATRWVTAAGDPAVDVVGPCLADWFWCPMNSFALGDGLIYAVTSGSRLVAVDAADGAVRWQVDVADRYAIPGDPLVSPVAVPGGVMLRLGHTVDGTLGEWGNRFVRLDGADGAHVWQRRLEGHPQPQVVADGERVFIGLTELPGGCCAILAVDLRTGEDVWRSESARLTPLGTTDGGALYALGTVTSARREMLLYALDPATGRELWRERIPGTPTLPLAADGTMFIRTYDRLSEARLVAYRPVSAVVEGAATPIP